VRTKGIIFLLYVISMMIILAGCAKKGPPVPWETIVPKRITDLAGIPRDGRLFLTWGVPKENTDKSPLTDLAGFKILRSEGVLIGDECKGCNEKAKVIYEMKLDVKKEGKENRMMAYIDDQEAKKVYVYSVVSSNRRGYSSAPSNPVTIYWDTPPQPPGMVKAVSGDKKVDLSWEPVEGVTGYNVYRRLENEGYPIVPLNTSPLTTTQFTDLNVENEKQYIYTVRALKRVIKTDVEGKGATEVSAIPTDLVPPAAPADLVAFPLEDGIELSWKKNRESDLLGYNVYRRKIGEKEFVKLNEGPVPKEIFLDKKVVLGQEYEYAVSAVDNSERKNESPLSEEVRVKYLK
jgi:uncharacterized protein